MRSTILGCVSRPPLNRQEFAATEVLYNATAFNVEQEVEFGGVTVTDDPEAILTVNHTVKVFPTTYNGLCKSYEFHDVHKIRTYAGIQVLKIVSGRRATYSIRVIHPVG